MTVSADTLPINGVADAVVPVQVAHGLTVLGWALHLLPEDGVAKPILGSEQTLPCPQLQHQGLTGEGSKPVSCSLPHHIRLSLALFQNKGVARKRLLEDSMSKKDKI